MSWKEFAFGIEALSIAGIVALTFNKVDAPLLAETFWTLVTTIIVVFLFSVIYAFRAACHKASSEQEENIQRLCEKK